MATTTQPTATSTETGLRGRKQAHSTTTAALPSYCSPFTLPSLGHISLGPESTLTLTENVVFTPECAPTAAFNGDGGVSSVLNIKDPFHSSVTPQAYATGAATVIAWMLVIMLLITPRTFFMGGMGGGVGLLGRRGMISGSQGGNSVIGVGSRPWLQKVAALTVAISLTIATADTFEVAERQYVSGFMDAEALRSEVVASTQIKISRVVSDIFLWLAQVQTLIRLFPRHKEKVLIKWIGFALIILDSTFSCLNSFMGNPVGRPRRFRDAIPALSYLFQLALSMLYAAWVIYYAVCKRRYAFYHSSMSNVSLVAVLSIIAIFTPVVFFITDISNSTVAGWGDYFRWVGAAAASVIVWEWVERIEALEREEKKDGILGREVFDGDEMLDTNQPDNMQWPRNRRNPGRFWRGHGPGGGDGGDGGSGTAYSSGTEEMGYKSSFGRMSQHISGESSTLVPSATTTSSTQKRLSQLREGGGNLGAPYLSVPTPPPAAVSPVSRSDTTSAASTVYTVRYHPLNLSTPPVARRERPEDRSMESPEPVATQPQEEEFKEKDVVETEGDERDTSQVNKARWNPFKRRKALPPTAVQQGQVIDPVAIGSTGRQQPIHNYHAWDIKGRIGAFAAEQGEKWRERGNRQPGDDDNLPVTIIPAQPRGEVRDRPWSPDNLDESPSSSHATPSSRTGLFPASIGRATSADPSTPALSDGTRSDTWPLQPPESIEVRLQAATPLPGSPSLDNALPALPPSPAPPLPPPKSTDSP